MLAITTRMELDLSTIQQMDDITFYSVVVLATMSAMSIACLIMMDDFTDDAGPSLYLKVIELSNKIDELNNSMTEDDDDIPVFRFMDGSSFYIIDDDDEFVLVGPNMHPKRVVSIESINTRPVTRLHAGGGITMYAEDVEGDRIRLTMTNFHDEFERDMFVEFIEENGFKFNKE